MAFYLLDAICSRNVFLGWILIWHIFEFPIHVYFSFLWENMCKISITKFFDGFIDQVHSLIFKKYYPRLSEAAGRVIYNIGNWYLEERSTYIIIFGATRSPHLL